jgi:hypothetical protein
MRVAIVSLLFNQWLLLVGRAFATEGFEVLMITTIDPLVGDADHEDTMKRYKGFPNTSLLPIEFANPMHSDLLICGFRPGWSHRMQLLYDPWLQKTNDLALVYSNAKGEAAFRMATELKILSRWPSLFRTSRFTTDDFHPQSSVFSLFARGSYFGATFRQPALCDEALLGLLLSPFDPMAPRQHFAAFIGSYQPASRSRVVDTLVSEFQQHPDVVLLDGGSQLVSGFGKKTVFWHLSEIPDQPLRLDFRDYLYVLEQTDFSFCLPGYVGTTNRTVEALCRGSIPVLPYEERRRYDLPLQDGKNCIFVKSSRWVDSFRRIKSLEDSQILKIRKEVAILRNSFLDWTHLAQTIRTKFLGTTIAERSPRTDQGRQ